MQLYQMVLILAVIAIALVAVVVLAVRSLRQSRTAPRRAIAKARETPISAAAPQADVKTERRRKLIPASQTEEQPSPPEVEPAAVEAPTSTEGEEPSCISFATAVMAKLEEAFDLYQADEITLEAYGALLVTEQASVERHIADLHSSGSSQDALDDAEAAREAVEWCLRWTEDIARGHTAAAEG